MAENIISNAALIDHRPTALTKKDYSTKELNAVSAIPTFENERIRKLTATTFNQWYVGSCVPHGFYTQLEYEGILPKDWKPSQLRAYRKRINYPGAGSIGPDMYDQIKKGQSNDFPTPKNFKEHDATSMPYVTGEMQIEDFKYFQYNDPQTGRILVEDMPADIAAGKAVAIFIYATMEEWSNEFVELKTENLNISTAEVRHCICLIPKGDFTYKGKRWLAVHDSANFAGKHLRYIEYDNFFKTRCYFAAKVYKTEDTNNPPIVSFDLPITECKLNDEGLQVVDLQSYLHKKGKLKKAYITGFYGPITAKAVLWWQLEHWNQYAYDIPQLLEWAGENWGQQSISIVKKEQ